MKTAIITGITGQDGSYLAELLLNKGYKVVGCLRSYSNSSLSKLKNFKIDNEIVFEECDLTDISSIIKLFSKHKPSEVYNLAAQSSVGLSFEQPIGTIQFNLLSVLNILECIRIIDNKIKFYQASSSEMYGRVVELPITEKTTLHPLSPYAISKAAAYWTVVNYRESYGIYAANGILFNHESILRSDNFFIRKVVKESVKIAKGLQTELRVGNIDIRRDFGFAPEYVKAMWLMLQVDKPEDFLICSGSSVSLREVIFHVFRKLEISLRKLVSDPSLYRPTEIKDIYGDNTKAKEILGWDYEMSFFDVLDLLIENELNR
jgi:GDPmannose 4,6-dehydratase